MLTRLQSEISRIVPTDKSLLTQAQIHLDNLTKPRGSLGRLEELAAKLFCIRQGQKPQVDPAIVFTCAGDHGVAAEGVSLFPQEVTRQMVLNFLNGGAAINVLTKSNQMDLKVVDAGCLGGSFPEHLNLIQRKVRPGTGNIVKEPAMNDTECLTALLLGISLAEEAQAQGYLTLGTGEMGIANTSPATALYCAYLGCDPADITGPGTGLDHQGVSRKTEVIRRALAVNLKDQTQDHLAILTRLGGLEIACLTGLILGGAARRMAVIVDGFISTAAYVAAWKLCPHVSDYAFFAHGSAEPGHMKILKILNEKPLFDLGLRLGEGTGAALAVSVLRSSANIYNQMASFAQAGVSQAGSLNPGLLTGPEQSE